MNTQKRLLVVSFSFLLFVFLVNLAHAQEDFKATSPPSVKLCPCSNQAYAITIENTGTVSSSYKVSADGNIDTKWIKFDPSSFILNPGKKGSFFVP